MAQFVSFVCRGPNIKAPINDRGFLSRPSPLQSGQQVFKAIETQPKDGRKNQQAVN